MIEQLKKIVMLALFLAAAPASAQQPPWETSKPRGMTQAHERYAASALEALTRLGRDFNGNPAEFHDETWTWEGGRNGVSPLSNMDTATLRAVMNGRYHVKGSSLFPPYWDVVYHAPNGVAHFCLAQEGGRYVEYTLDWYAFRTVFGLSGLLYWHPEKSRSRRPNPKRDYGWPMVGDGRTGRIAVFGWDGDRWADQQGWVQPEYAAAFAERCPNLPRVSEVNNAQQGRSLQDLRRAARPVGFRTAFENDPADPLTVNMFYWAHPPR